MDYYHQPGNEEHLRNIADFKAVLAEFVFLKPLKPSPDKAPWHVQAVIEGRSGQIVLNFWPHTGKAQRDGCYSVQGFDAICAMIVEALDDADEDLAVIE